MLSESSGWLCESCFIKYNNSSGLWIIDVSKTLGRRTSECIGVVNWAICLSVSSITIELVPLLPVLVWLLVHLLVEVMEGAETFLLELELEHFF